jgi:hypothetical protein
MGYGRPLRPSPEPVDRVELLTALNTFLRSEKPVIADGRSAVTSSDSLA